MADVEKILRLVSEGVLTPEEADEILSATAEPETVPPGGGAPGGGAPSETSQTSASPRTDSRHLRIEVTEGGKRVVNLRVPMNIAGWASSFLPGLSDNDTDRIRGAIQAGTRGPILDIGDDDGSRVLIVTE